MWPFNTHRVLVWILVVMIGSSPCILRKLYTHEKGETDQVYNCDNHVDCSAIVIPGAASLHNCTAHENTTSCENGEVTASTQACRLCSGCLLTRHACNLRIQEDIAFKANINVVSAVSSGISAFIALFCVFLNAYSWDKNDEQMALGILISGGYLYCRSIDCVQFMHLLMFWRHTKDRNTILCAVKDENTRMAREGRCANGHMVLGLNLRNRSWGFCLYKTILRHLLVISALLITGVCTSILVMLSA
jgi:hypothetical protein